MRKIQLLLALIFICSTSTFAQLQKNKFYPGLSSGTWLNQGSPSYELQPSGSLALDKHSLLTVFGRFQRTGLYNNPYVANSSGRMSEHGFGIGYGYYRYFKGSKKFGWYVEATASINRVNLYDIKSTGAISVWGHTDKQFYITPGLFYQLSPRIMAFLNFGGIPIVGMYPTNRIGTVVNVGLKITLGKVGQKTKK